MGRWTDQITHVRVAAAALAACEGIPSAPPGTLEVTWHSGHADRWHQVYVNGRLGGVTAEAADRRLVVGAPVGRAGSAGLALVEVVAVDAADRWTDFAEELDAFAGAGARARLTWQAGPHLDPDLEAFDVFADGASGTIDYTTPLNESPIPARPGGEAPWGYGTGGFGSGGYGDGSAAYEWTTDPLGPGTWRFVVLASDAAGNRLAEASTIACDVLPLPRPPTNFGVASYDPGGATATLAWQKSPDV